MCTALSQIDKLVAKLKARPPEASFADVEAVLAAYGWEKRRTKGSHHTYRKPGEAELLTIPTVGGRTVKRTYLDKVCEMLGLDDES